MTSSSFSLQSDMIARAKERTEVMNLDERTEEIEGRLSVLPERARRLEFAPYWAALPSLKGARYTRGFGFCPRA